MINIHIAKILQSSLLMWQAVHKDVRFSLFKTDINGPEKFVTCDLKPGRPKGSNKIQDYCYNRHDPGSDQTNFRMPPRDLEDSVISLADSANRGEQCLERLYKKECRGSFYIYHFSNFPVLSNLLPYYWAKDHCKKAPHLNCSWHILRAPHHCHM